MVRRSVWARRAAGGAVRVTAVVAALALVAGCGRAGGDDDASTTTDPDTTSTVEPGEPGGDDPTATTKPATTPDPDGPVTEGEVIDGTFTTSDGRQRTYRLVIPAGLPAESPVPLLVALHGGGGSGSQFEGASGFSDLAASEGFVVAYPDGIQTDGPAGQLRTWNAGACCAGAMRAGVDDVEFVRGVIDQVGFVQPIDADRVFVAGHSNGGMLAYRVACEAADVVAAVAVVAGGLVVDDCAPSGPISLLHLHGTADTHVPLDGGVGEDSLVGIDFPGAEESAGGFAAVAGCDDDPVEADDPTDAGVTTETWACGDVEVELDVIDGATHPWPGSAKSEQPGGSSGGVDASRRVWAFLAAHPRP